MTAMKATLVACSPRSLDELRKRTEAEGLDVVQALVRRPHDALAPLLTKAQGDILVLESADVGLAADLPALAEATHANPTLAVLVLSPQQDSESLLAAMRSGVREMLPPQPAAGDFAAALRRIEERAAVGGTSSRARVIAFLPCKGGSGSTFLATNVAWCLAAEHGKRTVLLDLDLQYGDAAYFVSNGHARASLADLARQIERLDTSLLEASMIEVAPNFKLLPAPEEPEAALGVTPAQLERLIDVACVNHDDVVLDVERMLDPLSIKALDKASVIFLVTENMVPHTRDARRIVRILHALGYGDDRLRLVVNRHARHGGIELDKIESVVGLKVAHVIPEGAAEVTEAVNTGVPLVQLHPGSAVAREIRRITATLAENHAARRSWLGRLIGAEA